MADNKIVQIIELPGAGRYALKADGKWYYQLVSGGMVTSESVMASAPTGQQATSGTVSPGAGAPLTAEQAKKNIAALEGLKADAQGLYLYNGEKITSARRNQLIKEQKDRLSAIEKQTSGMSATRETAQYEKFAPQIAENGDKLQAVSSLRVGLESTLNKITNTTEYQNVLSWVNYYKSVEQQLQKNIDAATAGNQSGIKTVNVVFVTEREAKAKSQSVTTMAPQPNVGNQGGFAGAPVGQVTTPPAGSLTAAQRGEQGIQQGQGTPTPSEQPVAETKVSTTSTTPAKTPVAPTAPTAPGAPAPAGPGMTVTDPTTGQPVTLPAGIDFAWLASQTPSTPPAWEQAAIELYGGYYEVIKNIPELRGLIGRAMTGGWSEDKFQYELEQTTWWRTTTASARAWEEQKVRDPASLQTLIDNKTAAIRDEALTLGIRIDDASLSKLAEDSLKFGWSDQVLTNAVGMEALKSQAGVSQLRQGYYGQSIKSIASNYGVPLSDTVTNQWIAKIASGQENEASFQAYVRDLSKNLYPALSSGFDRGLTFSQMTSPYAQYASNILEIPEAQVDFTDPKWAAAFTMKDAKGQQTQMSFGEWADYLRTNPAFGYEYTDGAQQKAYQVANQLARLFGAA